jgi:enoyl-CoA hydratase/carnithine racemase
MVQRTAMTVERHDGVLHAEMHHPHANSLDGELVTALAEVVDEFVRGDAKVLLLSSGIPDFFATGAHPSHISSLSAEELADYRDALRAPLERLAMCRRPSIAAFDGHALGSGLELAMACTLRFCTPAARLGFPDARGGLIPAAGGTQRLPRLVGSARALELLLSGREITGEEASRIGLVERLLGTVVTEAHEVAASFARASGTAVEALMGCVDAAQTLPHSKGMAVEGVALLSMFDDDDVRDRADAIVARRL